MAVCMIPNCRKTTASDEAFCVDHRDPPDLSHGFGRVYCAIGINRGGSCAGELDFALAADTFDKISVHEFVETLDAIRRSVTVTNALRKASTPREGI